MSKEWFKAVKNGDVGQVQGLLEADAALLEVTDAEGNTALHFAAWKGHKDLVEALLKAGANIQAANRNDHWGTTALHAAAHANHQHIVELLITHGADIQAKDTLGRTPLTHTTFHNAKAAARVLTGHGATE